MKPVLYSAAAAAALAVAAGAYFGSASAAPQSTFVLLDGTTAKMTDLRGKVTLVNFWTTSCTPCVAGMPKIAAAYDKYHTAGFEAVAVAMRSDRPTDVAMYAETRRLPFKVAIDASGELGKAWGGVQGAPTMYLLNRRGEVVKRFTGEVDFDAVQRLVEKLLAQT
jgi:thiol-disulfide isomerase/thioredoxin